MRNKRFKLIVITIIVIFIGICFWIGYNFNPGSYPYAERYELNYSEQKVKKAIAVFKIKHPEFIVPKVTIKNKGAVDLKDGFKGSSLNFYYAYFYNTPKNEIIVTWVGGDNDKTIIAFISVNKGLDLGHWKDINHDFSDVENEKQKELFQKNILAKIQQELNTQ